MIISVWILILDKFIQGCFLKLQVQCKNSRVVNQAASSACSLLNILFLRACEIHKIPSECHGIQFGTMTTSLCVSLLELGML